MCLALPGKILSFYIENQILMAQVDFSGTIRPVCLAFTPDAQLGNYVIVHVGFAIQILSELQAQKNLQLLNELIL